MHRTLLADDARPRIGIAAGANIGDHPLLPWDDVKEHVRDHDGPDDRADVDIRCARAEHVEQRPCACHDEHEHQRREHVLLAFEQAAETVVDEPSTGQRPDADRNCRGRRERHHATIDQIRACAEPVDERKQCDSR